MPVKASPQDAPLSTAVTIPAPTPSWRYGQKLTDVPNEPVITYEQYQKLENRMTYEAVCALFGRPGLEEHFFRSGDSSTARYLWKNPDESYVTVWFGNGKVSAKININLR